jgi:phosphoribosylanthranilate isomerase
MAVAEKNRRTRIKICGITRPDDGLAAAELGADAIGLVFYSPSPRAVTLEQARQIAAALPPFVCKVALFVDPAPAYVNDVLASVPIDLLQFHGDEAAADCNGYGVPYIKAARVQPGFDLDLFTSRYPDACGILLDAYAPDRRGGTGITFDWSLIPEQREKPLLLAGGLHAGNVAEAVRIVRPYAVDVSGGVEADKGIKDPARVAAFIHEVQNA